MSLVAGRPHRAGFAPLLALIAAGLIVALAACDSATHQPAASQQVAGVTDLPATPAAARTAAATGGPRATPGPDETSDPSATAAPTEPVPTDSAPTPGEPGVTAIVPGAVDRTSLQLTASYDVKAAITVRTGALDVTTAIFVRNDSGDGIDRLELNTIAARLGGMKILATTVDDTPVKATIHDQTVTVPLGGVLPNGAATTIRIEYRATLVRSTAGSDWMFSRSGGVLTLYRWIPWVSAATPFDRPNGGQPFVTPMSPKVDVELLTDAPLDLAAPAAHVDEFAAGAGTYWAFSATEVRDVAIVLAPEFRVAQGEADGVPVRAFSRPGGPSATQLLDIASGAVRSEADELGMAFPAASMTVIDTPAGVALESPGMVWVPRKLDARNRTYAIYQGVAHQWFYGLVGNDQRAEPFADEAPSDLLARTVLHTLRGSRCGQVPLDRPLTKYTSGCYFEQVFVQGGGVLAALRQRMGSTAFWAALRGYLNQHRGEIAGTKDLLEALRAGTTVDLMPILQSRFPSMY